MSVLQVADQLQALAFTKTGSPRKMRTVSVLPAELAPLRRTRQQKIPPPTPTTTHCHGKRRGVHSVLRSGVEQRSFGHSVSPLQAFTFAAQWRGTKNKEHTDDAHTTSEVTLGWIMASYAHGGRRALELQLWKNHSTTTHTFHAHCTCKTP